MADATDGCAKYELLFDASRSWKEFEKWNYWEKFVITACKFDLSLYLSVVHTFMFPPKCSLALLEFGLGSVRSGNSGVGWDHLFRVREDVRVCCNELTGVERATVSNGDLWGVLVWHHNLSLHQTVPIGVGVVSMQGLVAHTSVGLRASLVCVAIQKMVWRI